MHSLFTRVFASFWIAIVAFVVVATTIAAANFLADVSEPGAVTRQAETVLREDGLDGLRTWLAELNTRYSRQRTLIIDDSGREILGQQLLRDLSQELHSTLERQEVDLVELVRQVVHDVEYESQSPLATAPSLACTAAIALHADPQLLHAAFDNIRRNALLHGGEGPIEVDLVAGGDGVIAKIRDHGPGATAPASGSRWPPRPSRCTAATSSPSRPTVVASGCGSRCHETAHPTGRHFGNGSSKMQFSERPSFAISWEGDALDECESQTATQSTEPIRSIPFRRNLAVNRAGSGSSTVSVSAAIWYKLRTRS